jgi:hypothetical protein
MVTLELPELVSVSDRVALLPTCTLPKARLGGLATRLPAALVPMPDRGTTRVGFEALLMMVRLPLLLPVDLGVKVIMNDTV